MKERILALRKALGMNQGQFGKELGITASGVSNLENGVREIQERHLKLITAAFPTVSEAWLRTGEGSMFKAPDGEVERLVKKYDFPDIVGKLLTIYGELSPLQQEAVLEVARKLIASMEDNDGIEAQVEAYRQELLAQKETNALSASRTESAEEA